MRMWVVPRLINRPVDELFHQRDFLFNQFIKEKKKKKIVVALFVINFNSNTNQSIIL